MLNVDSSSLHRGENYFHVTCQDDRSQLPLEFAVAAQISFYSVSAVTNLHPKERFKQLMHSIVRSNRIFYVKFTLPFIHV